MSAITKETLRYNTLHLHIHVSSLLCKHLYIDNLKLGAQFPIVHGNTCKIHNTFLAYHIKLDL